MAAPRTPSGLLDQALARDPARPLLTFYDDATGERTELSVATFENWVAKTANLVRDDLDLAPGARVVVHLPLHWQAAVWLQACWALRLVVVAPPARDGRADLAVVTHEHSTSGADEVVSLGLGPMGLARPGHAPAHTRALDYDREVHGHGDRFAAESAPREDDPAMESAGRTATGGELAAAALAAPALPPGGRLLVTAALDSPAAAVGGLLVPLATQATAVLCRHLDPATLPGRAAEENLLTALQPGPGTAPRWAPVTAT